MVMGMREKLIKLVEQSLCDHIHFSCKLAENIADDLIANGVTVPKRGHWIIRSSGRGSEATNWAECSECLTCGSPQWKVCPVCEARMEGT